MQSMTEMFPNLSGMFETALPAARVIEPQQDVPGNASTTVVIEPGDQVFESLAPAGDQDWYRLDLEADERVVLAVVPDGGAPLPEGRLEVVRQNGQVLESRIIGDSTAPIVISRDQAEEVFVRVVSENGGTGDYQLVVDTALPIPFEDPNNLLRLGLHTGLVLQGDPSDVAGRRIEFTFADTGDVFDNRFATPRAADSDWTGYERQQLALAMQQFANVLDIEIVETSNQAQAEIVFFAAETGGSNSNNLFSSQGFLGLAFLPTGGSLAGNVIFNTTGFGWDRDASSGDSFDGHLEQFGLGFATMLHELGHAFGLDHPYETNSGSILFPGLEDNNGDGLTDDLFNDSGDFGLNQTVFTAMSDVTGFTEHPDGVSQVFNFTSGLATRPEFGGHAGTMMALDVALLQEIYGARERVAMGDDVYDLPDSQTPDTGYSLIWDNGGTDVIRYQGNRDARIDLRPATLQVEEGGGGFVSFVNGGSRVLGGFTIAHGVDVENAESDNGDDLLRGNALDNVLSAGAGSDTVDGGGGNDQLDGGAGTDVLSYASLAAPSLVIGTSEFGVFVNLENQGQAQDTGHGSDLIENFENLDGSDFA
ncbi:MAG: matrixin family metalloprotease, partial [Pseudomonadota bacterium]